MRGPLRVDRRLRARLLVIAATCAPLASCVHVAVKRSSDANPPAQLLGRFTDDYGEAYEVVRDRFVQLPNARYHIVEWNTSQQYLIAQNDSANRTDAKRWTRIDWLTLQDMAPYSWAFCLTAWKAPTRDSARATAPPKRDIPRSGCGGFPFTRMRADSSQT